MDIYFLTSGVIDFLILSNDLVSRFAFKYLTNDIIITDFKKFNSPSVCDDNRLVNCFMYLNKFSCWIGI